MSKVLATAASIVGIAALAVATYGASIGPTAAAAAGSAGIGTVSVSSLATILAATTAGLGIAAKLAAPKASSTVNPTEWSVNPNAGIPLALGRRLPAAIILKEPDS